MKFVKSTTQKTWYIQGKKIPACVTSDNDYLRLTDGEFAELEKQAIANSLIKNGAIIVLDEEPDALRNKVDQVHIDNAQLRERNTQLEEELKALKAGGNESVDVEAIKAQAQEEIKAEAVKELQDKQAALDDAQAKLAEAQKELEALKKKANK